MRRKKGDEGGHIDETWLIPYADLLTLLLALFIVLFASSAIDEAKLSAMSIAFYEEYNGMMPDPEIGDPGMGGDYSGSNLIPGQAVGGDDPETIVDFFSTHPPDPNDPSALELHTQEAAQELALEAERAAQAMVSELQNDFTNYVEENELHSEMSLEVTEDGLLITLTSDVWFDSGSAEVNEPQKEIASQISKMIADVQEKNEAKLSVVISGHTDNVAMSSTNVYANNWELSVARAVNFMEELMYSSALEPSNFSARGFGEYEPIDTNDTAEGRQRNRRVEVMISADKNALGDIEAEVAAADNDVTVSQ